MTPLLESYTRIGRFRLSLLRWYDGNKRSLPWRDVDDPYKVWVSEIMLQQTQVDRVREFFERFVAAFPTVGALASATESEVLKVCEGMGYYSRARNMLRAAQQMVATHGARIPDQYAELIDLPGGVPSSIAYDRDHPVLDGNVIRALCRIILIEEDPRGAAVKTDLIAASERLLERRRPGDFNQAMMELGARVCTPYNPQCHNCPVSRWCRARTEFEDPADLPVKGKRKERPHLQVAAGLIWEKRELLIARRPSEGMLGGLWEFPGGKLEEGESLRECLKREIAEELDIHISVGNLVARVDHGYTHFSITLHAFEATFESGTPKAIGCSEWKWVKPAGLDAVAMPRADRRVLESIVGTRPLSTLQPSHAMEGALSAGV